MGFKTNVPSIKEQRVYSDTDEFKIGDRVRVLSKNKLSECIGKITSIDQECFYLEIRIGIGAIERKQILVSEVGKMRIASPNENFNDSVFFDDEEKEFWRTHIISGKGIRERTESEKVDW